jgi:hypothetical protein
VPIKLSPMTYDPDALSRELYNRSAILTQAAHALTITADQLVQAHNRDHSKSAAAVRTATYAAVRAALSACELIGAYDLARWIARKSRPR